MSEIVFQTCPRCKKVLEHYGVLLKNLDKYVPYRTWSPKGRSGKVTFTKHAYRCEVCGHKWVSIA